jgi:Fungal specific transcription factor domain
MVIIILILANYNYQVAIRNPAVAKEKMKDSHHMFHYGLSVMCELWLDGSLEAMQGMALLLLHARCLPKPAYTWHLSTHVLNKLIDAGYHRSSSELGLRESPLALEMRKRVFWAVLGINVETGSKLGRPMPMRMDDIGVELPTALEDSEISENGIALPRSGRCAFWAGVYVSKLVPYLIDLYNNFISVRRPPSDYLKNLETLNAKIVDFRQNWTKDTSVEPQGPSIKAATHHVDSWAAEFQLILHHPHLCTTTSPEVMEKNLDQCHQAADRLLKNATALFNIYRGVDFTWYSTVGYVLAFGVTLQIHRQRKDQLTRERFNAMKKELTDWLTIMGVADRVLRESLAFHNLCEANSILTKH